MTVRLKQFFLRLYSAVKAVRPVLLPNVYFKSRSRREITIPLIDSFRFIHEPVGVATRSRFIGRENDLESLAERILFSDGGSFLVTGYRGVGKTSFVNQVVRTLEDALPWAERRLGKTEIVDLYLSVARPIQPSEIMHHVIRRLHDRLIEKGIFPLLNPHLQESLTMAYYRTSLNMVRKLAETSERTFGVNEASIGGDWMKASIKLSANSKRNLTRNYEMSYLGYDDKAAEHDVITICKALSRGYTKPYQGPKRLRHLFSNNHSGTVHLKIVFVFDELDKLEELTTDNKHNPLVIDQILSSLKNLFTTSGVTFVFVAGKDLHERWLDNVGKGDSVYESVFSYDKYLPCLWADVGSMCDPLVASLTDLTPYARTVYDEFKKYLAYKGRGIPRRIIRTFNEYVEWDGDLPVLGFSRSMVRRIRFFSGIQDVVDANDNALFGETHEETIGTQSDKRRLGVYYLIDWIFRQGSSQFRFRDVLNASKRLSAKIALAEEVLPEVVSNILRILTQFDYVEEIRSSLNRVVIDQANALESGTADENRYRIAPRRLGEIGGSFAEGDFEEAFGGKTVTVTNTFKGVENYKVVRVIAQGGMGTVYEALDSRNGRRVAIKTMARDSDSDMIRRFEREAKILRQLNHPNVVRFYGSGREDRWLYIAMEFLDGLTLEDLLWRKNILDIDLVVAIAKPITDAVHYVHQKGFVRNDIKPNNIILTNAGRVCLLDFGISRPAQSDPMVIENGEMFHTGSHVVIGTVQFMAPEQFELADGYEIDRRADIYSFGVVLYRMLTGVYPFIGKSPERFAGAHVIRPPSDYTQVPPEIDAIVLKCLKHNPMERFQTMLELQHALCTAAGQVKPVNLRNVVAAVSAEVQQVQAMDGMVTLQPSITDLLRNWSKGSPSSDSGLALPGLMAIEQFADHASTQTKSESKAIPKLSLIEGNAQAVKWNITRRGRTLPLINKIRVGRSSDNNLILRHKLLSRFHAEFGVTDDRWFIEDLNSGLGTYVNDKRVLTPTFLTNGDKIQFGGFIFRFG